MTDRKTSHTEETYSSDKNEKKRLKREFSHSSKSEGFRGPIYNPEISISPTEERVSLDDALIAANALNEIKKRKYQRKEPLGTPSQPFFNEQEISSRTEELSNIVKNISKDLFGDLRVKYGKRQKQITYIIRKYYNNKKTDKDANKVKSQIVLKLEEKMNELESYHSRPDKTINDATKKEISPVLIDAHRLLADIAPDWSNRFPQLHALHTHIDTELKKIRNSE